MRMYPVLNQARCHGGVWESGGIFPCIPRPGTTRRWVVSFTLRPLYPLFIYWVVSFNDAVPTAQVYTVSNVKWIWLEMVNRYREIVLQCVYKACQSLENVNVSVLTLHVSCSHWFRLTIHNNNTPLKRTTSKKNKWRIQSFKCFILYPEL
jgi:hypothetical protein